VGSPLSAFDDWLGSQPPGIQSDLVALALAHLPGSGVDVVDMLGDDIVTPFRASLEVLQSEGNAFQQVCAVVAIRAAAHTDGLDHGRRLALITDPLLAAR
jgi:hypothetical protein